MDRADVEQWLVRYECAWRAQDTAVLDEVFTESVTYVTSPWADAIVGREKLRRFWEVARAGPHEGFRMRSEIVAVDGRMAVVRVHVDYDDGQLWRDLWLFTLNHRGLCEHFEEWPFAVDQDDGHRDEQF